VNDAERLSPDPICCHGIMRKMNQGGITSFGQDILFAIEEGYENTVENWWININLLDLAAADAARHRLRTSGVSNR